MTDTENPYSDAWRRRTLKRIAALGLDRADIVARTGLRAIIVHDALCWSIPVSLEVAGPIDELLDQLELEAEDAAVTRDAVEVAHVQLRNGKLVEVQRVDVDLGALAGCDVQLWGEP